MKRDSIYRFDAFISYNHNEIDSPLATALKSLLEQYAKPLFKWRAARVFQDVHNLESTPSLWPKITSSLDSTHHFILIASPGAASSLWVKREICYWLSGRDITPEDFSPQMVLPDRLERMHLVMSQGAWRWTMGSTAQGDFDWPATTALPQLLKGVFAYEPNIADLRAITSQYGSRPSSVLSPVNQQFVNSLAKVVAPIRNCDMEALTSEDYRQHRRRIRILLSLTVGLAVALLVAITGGWIAVNQRSVAIARERESRHEQGVSWLARSAASERERDYLAAKLMALRAINHNHQAENGEDSLDLLRVNSVEYREALKRLARLPECNIVWAARRHAEREQEAAQCAFSSKDSSVAAIWGDGRQLRLSLNSGLVEVSRHDPADLVRVAASLEVDQVPGESMETILSNGDRVRISLAGRQGSSLWVESSGVSRSSPLPDEALWYSSNDGYVELVKLARACKAAAAIATFKNNYVSSVVVLRKGQTQVVYRRNGEVSDDKGIVQCIDACVSQDASVIAISESNRRNNVENAIVIQKAEEMASYGVSRRIAVDGEAPTQLSISPRNRLIAGCVGSEIRVWDIAQGSLLVKLTGHQSPVLDVAFDEDEHAVASVSRDGTLLVWSIPIPDYQVQAINDLPPRFKPILLGEVFRTEGEVTSAEDNKNEVECTSPQGDLVARWQEMNTYVDQGEETRSGDLVIKDLATGTEVVKIVERDCAHCENLRFSPNGLHLIWRGASDEKLYSFCRPRLRFNYAEAYKSVEFSEAGIKLCEVAKAGEAIRLTVAINFSLLYFRELIRGDEYAGVRDWYFASRLYTR
ncbi:MAG: TIR domain-containing protein [Pirellulales bacterium]